MDTPAVPDVGEEEKSTHLLLTDAPAPKPHLELSCCTLWVRLAGIFTFCLVVLVAVDGLCKRSLDDFDAYGVSRTLSSVGYTQLINKDELDLRTGYVTSFNGSIRDFDFVVSMVAGAPDGFYKPMLVVNGQSPGPLIEASTGDTIRVNVVNNLPRTSISLHFHGIDQKNSTWMDGVVGISQCAIPPGQNFTYKFVVAEQRGTFWYHAHIGVEYTDGLFGPIVIHDAEEKVPLVDDEKIIFIGESYHTFAQELLDHYLKPGSPWTPKVPGVEPLADNLLLNGQNVYNCSVVSTTYVKPAGVKSPCVTGETVGRLYTTRIHTNDRVRLRLINHSSYLSFWFSIDNHNISIIEIDGVEVEPINARGVYINIGQRYSVIIHCTQARGNYFIRATIPQSCFVPYSPYNSSGLEAANYQVKGILSYDDTDPDLSKQIPLGTEGNVTNPYGVDTNAARKPDEWEGCDDMPFDMPKPIRAERAYNVAPGASHSVSFQFRQVGEVNRIFINKTSWAPYHTDATLWQAVEQEHDFAPGQGGSYGNWNFRLDQQNILVPDTVSADEGVQIAINSLDVMEHPFHFHGHSVQIVGWGPGLFDPNSGIVTIDNEESTTTTTWNLENPMRRDTFTIPGMWHVVIRFKADNPGVWALHCHVAWHLEAGMLVSVLERPAELKKLVAEMDEETRMRSLGFCEDRKGGNGTLKA